VYLTGKTCHLLPRSFRSRIEIFGKVYEMYDVSSDTPELTGEALGRAKRALASRKQPEPLDRQAARAELDALMNRVRTA
jgi:beta-N-acetylhexosaminidase